MYRPVAGNRKEPGGSAKETNATDARFGGGYIRLAFMTPCSLQRGIRFGSNGQDQRDLSAPLGTVRDADLAAVEIGHLLREGQS